jgi:hypothetical protein
MQIHNCDDDSSAECSIAQKSSPSVARKFVDFKFLKYLLSFSSFCGDSETDFDTLCAKLNLME